MHGSQCGIVKMNVIFFWGGGGVPGGGVNVAKDGGLELYDSQSREG